MDHIDLTDPTVRERVEYLGAHAERSIMQDFLARHPELLNVDAATDVENKNAVDAIMNENGLALSPENLEWAYGMAVEAGQIRTAMYHPLEQQAIPHMSTPQLKAYLEQKYAAPEKINYADFLPQFGERKPSAEDHPLDDEQCALMREKLQKGMGLR